MQFKNGVQELREQTYHNVHVKPVRTAFLNELRLRRQIGEVRGEHGRSDLHRHVLAHTPQNAVANSQRHPTNFFLGYDVAVLEDDFIRKQGMLPGIHSFDLPQTLEMVRSCESRCQPKLSTTNRRSSCRHTQSSSWEVLQIPEH